MNKKIISGRLLAGALFLASNPLVAAPTNVEIFQHPQLNGMEAGYAPHDIDGKPYMMRQVGAGLEHANVAVCGKHVLIAGVGSYERDALGVRPDMAAYGKNANTNDKLQTMMVAAELTTDGLEVGGAYYVLADLSGGNRNRDGMKPGVSCLDPDEGLFVVSANYALDDHARTYAGVFQVVRDGATSDLFPAQLGPSMLVLESANDNCSDRDYQDVIARKTPTGYRVNLTGSCNGNGSDVAWVTYFDVTCAAGYCSMISGPKAQVSQGQIERYRPQTFQLGFDTFLAIGTEGDTQPPQDGISATVFNGDTLALLSSTKIADDVIEEGIGTYYSTMSHGAQVGPNTFIVTYQQRNGLQRRGGKSGTTLMMGVLEADATGARWVVPAAAGMIEGFGATHHTACTARYGTPEAAEPAAFLVSASLTGGTAATGSFVTYSGGELKVHPTIGLTSKLDTGLLSNYYGENPGNQGKNSYYCTTIKNPGFRVEGAWRPDVEEFVVVPGTARVATEAGMGEKLGLELLMIPAVVDPTIDPEEGSEGNDVAVGCGCSTQNDRNAPSLIILALGVAVVIRRRRNSKEVA
jgi:MYXO-CTERM domain-containing protein